MSHEMWNSYITKYVLTINMKLSQNSEQTQKYAEFVAAKNLQSKTSDQKPPIKSLRFKTSDQNPPI